MVHAVADSSFKQYLNPLKAFLYDAKLNGYSMNTADEIRELETLLQKKKAKK